MSKVSSDRIKFLVKELNIPSDISELSYPYYELNGTGNIFDDIAIASRAWRNVNKDVSKNIMSVINKHCQSSEEVDALLNAINGVE